MARRPCPACGVVQKWGPPGAICRKCEPPAILSRRLPVTMLSIPGSVFRAGVPLQDHVTAVLLVGNTVEFQIG